MAKVFSYTTPLEGEVIDTFSVLQKGFIDQFVYFRKDVQEGVFGLGRCIALSSWDDVDQILQGDVEESPVGFVFRRFDADNPKPADPMMSSFPRLRLMIPEVVLIANERGTFLQLNSLGPVYQGRVERFLKYARQAQKPLRRTISYTIRPDLYFDWQRNMNDALCRIETGRVDKLVLSRRQEIVADVPFSPKDLVLNLLLGSAQGTVFMYRYGEVFFCGCTPELLVRKKGSQVESMCLAGTTPTGPSLEASDELAKELFIDVKNRKEHDYVVQFIREVFRRNCYDVDIADEPDILRLKDVQHLYTPARAQVMEGVSLMALADQLHPTPALAGTPVGEALMALREIEDYNRGFFGGAVGFVTGDDDGELSVAIRSGVFDGERGWIYAGCGVVEGSTPESEYGEIDLKLKTILSAFDGEQE